ncbi:MAG: SDR family NAD(P)-dependent oxidoreductase [Pseudomonadales bacterium]|nr:SDR family NAD(P)-dependent oxidoreductase [Pseudomonadales bacterium]MCP5184417.1 SDR family NAD(P)-dependent oxidoreductase [Pseudomonadales bacterium]
MELRDRVAVITGGASGIGLATARVMAARGAKLVLVDIEQAALDAVAATFTTPVLTRVCDVRDHDAMVALAEDIVRTCGGVHVVFNNAGVAVGGPIAEMKHDDWRWVLDVDLWGPVHGVEAFLPHMQRQAQGGHILFTASFAGLVPNVGLGPYCAAKYGVVAIAEVLARELRGDNIGVSVLCPMRVATNIGSSERNRQADYGGAEVSPRVAPQGDDSGSLAGRVLDVDDVAEMVVEAVENNVLYILPHDEARGPVERRFQRIQRDFDYWAKRNATR